MSDMFGIGSIVNNLIGQAAHGSMSGSGTSVNNQSTNASTSTVGSTTYGSTSDTAASGTATSSTSTLDPTTIAALRQLTQLSSSGNIYSPTTTGTVGDAAALAKSLGSSAGGTRASIDANYDDIAKAVTQNFDETQRAATNQTVAQYGNGDSSFAQLMKSKDDRALATSLAGIGAQLDVQGVGAENTAEMTALQANQLANTESSSLDSGRVALSTALANALKGAETTSSQTTQTQQSSKTAGQQEQSQTSNSTQDTQGSTGSTVHQNTSSGSGLMGLFA